MKKYICYLILFLFFLFPSKCDAIVSPTKEFYINDYANILSSETEEYILKRSLALNEVDGTQIVVVTVPNLEGMSLESYSYNLFNSFGIGDKDKNNGLLLLLALEEREFRVEVGDGLGGILPDGKTGRFQDNYIIPYLKEDKWDEGIRNGYDAFYSEIVELNNLEVDYTKPIEYYGKDNEYDYMDKSLLFLTIILASITGISVNLASKEKKKRLIITYLSIWFALVVFSLLFYTLLFNYLLVYLFCFFCIVVGGSDTYSGGRYSSGSRSRSSSRSGFSGGGGRSSGGGSSRGF